MNPNFKSKKGISNKYLKELYDREGKIITFEEVQEKLKHKELKDYTDEDIFDRYIAYRNRRRIE